jgi:hypothetical protein
MADGGARLASVVACADADRLRIRAWPVAGALPYITIDVTAGDWDSVDRMLHAVQAIARTRLRASVAAGDGTPSRTWDGAWLRVTGAAA